MTRNLLEQALDSVIAKDEQAQKASKPKNECLKTRDKSDPYEVWQNNQGWTWLVLKKWQVDDSKAYARWYCFVTSPLCEYGEYGDVYVSEIKQYATRTA